MHIYSCMHRTPGPHQGSDDKCLDRTASRKTGRIPPEHATKGWYRQGASLIQPPWIQPRGVGGHDAVRLICVVFTGGVLGFANFGSMASGEAVGVIAFP